MRQTRIGLRITIATALLALTAVAVGPALSASAASGARVPLPRQGLLRDPSGQTDGCHLRAPALSIFPQGGVNTIDFPSAAGCPASADIHWMSGSITVWQVLPGGQWRLLLPNSLNWIYSSYNTPILGDQGQPGEAYVACSDLGLSGVVTIVNRVTVRARVQVPYHSPDPHPTMYVGQADRMQTLDCG
jgi:hypothetical protein